MTRKLGLLVLVGAVAFACGEAGQSMSGGAGAMDGGGGMANGGGATNGTGATGGTPEQNIEVDCNKMETLRADGFTATHYWAEFEVDPGMTEVTVCSRATPSNPAGAPPFYSDRCGRSKAVWYLGTTTGWVVCGTAIDYDNPDIPDQEYRAPLSVTVHR